MAVVSFGNEVKERIRRALEMARPFLEFERVRGIGTGSHCMATAPEERVFLFREGEGRDFYLTSDGGVEVWIYKDLGRESWERKFSRLVPFNEVNPNKVVEAIKERLEERKCKFGITSWLRYEEEPVIDAILSQL